MLDNKNGQPSQYRTENWVVVNDDVNRNYDIGKQVTFQTTSLKTSFCNYSDKYLFNGTGTDAAADKSSKQVDKQQTKKVNKYRLKITLH